MSKKNENCLEGMKCPNCGSLGPYKIVSSCWAVWTDEGTRDYTEFEFGDEDACICLNCEYNATVNCFEDAGGYGENKQEKVEPLDDAKEPLNDAEIERLAKDGKIVPAVKAYREVYGVGLREAKKAVDEIRYGKEKN